MPMCTFNTERAIETDPCRPRSVAVKECLGELSTLGRIGPACNINTASNSGFSIVLGKGYIL